MASSGIFQPLALKEPTRRSPGAAPYQEICSPLKFFNSALKSANLSMNDIGDGGVIAISEALKTNSTLTELGLESGYRSTNKIGPAGAQALADMLKVNSALVSLDLECNDIGGEGAAALAAVLPSR